MGCIVLTKKDSISPKRYRKEDAIAHYQSLEGESFFIPSSEIVKVSKNIQDMDAIGKAKYEYGGHFIVCRTTKNCIETTFDSAQLPYRGIVLTKIFRENDAKTYSPLKHFLVPYHVHPRYSKIPEVVDAPQRASEIEKAMRTCGICEGEIRAKIVRHYRDHLFNDVVKEYPSLKDIDNCDAWNIGEHLIFIDHMYLIKIKLDSKFRDKRGNNVLFRKRLAKILDRAVNELIDNKAISIETKRSLSKIADDYPEWLEVRGVKMIPFEIIADQLFLSGIRFGKRVRDEVSAVQLKL